MTAAPLNGDLTRRIAIDSEALQWSASPGGEVLRKRLHRVGPPESCLLYTSDAADDASSV